MTAVPPQEVQSIHGGTSATAPGYCSHFSVSSYCPTIPVLVLGSPGANALWRGYRVHRAFLRSVRLAAPAAQRWEPTRTRRRGPAQALWEFALCLAHYLNHAARSRF